MSAISINTNDLIIDAGSGVAMYWIIDKYLRRSFPVEYSDFLTVGLAGGVGLSVLSPILTNLMAGKNLLDGITIDKEMLIDMAIAIPTAGGLFYLIKMVFPSVKTDIIRRYVGVIGSIIGTTMIQPTIRKFILHEAGSPLPPPPSNNSI